LFFGLQPSFFVRLIYFSPASTFVADGFQVRRSLAQGNELPRKIPCKYLRTEAKMDPQPRHTHRERRERQKETENKLTKEKPNCPSRRYWQVHPVALRIETTTRREEQETRCTSYNNTHVLDNPHGFMLKSDFIVVFSWPFGQMK